MRNLFLEIDMKLTTNEFEELFKDYPLNSKEDAGLSAVKK